MPADAAAASGAPVAAAPSTSGGEGGGARLLVVSAYFDGHRGGVEQVAAAQAGALAARGFDVAWLASDASPAAPRPGVRLVAAPAWNGVERLGAPLPLPGPAALALLWREVGRAQAVILHDTLYPLNIAAFAMARSRRRPVLAVQHIGEVPYRNPLLRAAMRIGDRLAARPLLAGADQVAFISATTAAHFAAVRLKRPAELVFNGVDAAVFRPAGPDDRPAAETRAALGLPAAGPLAVFVGRFVEKKGLEAVRRMAAARPDVAFALAGWGAIEPSDWGLPNVTVLRGLGGASLAALYRAGDVLLLPSAGEGFPLVVQEALACGMPVLCGEETAQADPDATAHLAFAAVRPDDPQATADAFLPRLDAALAAGRTPAQDRERARFAHDRYAWERAGARYAALVAALLAPRAAARPVGAAAPGPVAEVAP